MTQFGRDERIAVIGGGLTGACVALELALAGRRVTLFEREPELLTRASAVNEGKIHLGYVYAKDRSLATAKTMISGALTFAPIVSRLLGSPPPFQASPGFLYAVHRDSQLSAEEVGAHLDATHAEILSAAGPHPDYFGVDLAEAPQPLAASEVASTFDPALVRAAFATPEVAVDPLPLCAAFRARIAAEPLIELRLSCEVLAVPDGDDGRPIVRSLCDGTQDAETFDRVVNAAWENRLALDATHGIAPARNWIHRYKYGVRLPASGAAAPTTTFVLGPFGDIVRYPDGSLFLSWYPVCLADVSRDLAPPPRPAAASAENAARIARESLAALVSLSPGLEALSGSLSAAEVRGGHIFAWGETDIHDVTSGLHERHRIGVASGGRHLSIDTGKLVTAPLFAQACAEILIRA